jgi:hypothetical protein
MTDPTRLNTVAQTDALEPLEELASPSGRLVPRRYLVAGGSLAAILILAILGFIAKSLESRLLSTYTGSTPCSLFFS